MIKTTVSFEATVANFNNSFALLGTAVNQFFARLPAAGLHRKADVHHIFSSALNVFGTLYSG